MSGAPNPITPDGVPPQAWERRYQGPPDLPTPDGVPPSGWPGGGGLERPIPRRIELWCVPSFCYVFCGDDENRIPKTIDLCNEEMKIIRDIYLNFHYKHEGKTGFLELENGDKNEFLHMVNHVEAIHQFLAPLFINQDIEINKYNKFMDNYETLTKFCKNQSKETYLNVDDFFKKICLFSQSVQDCFDDKIKIDTNIKV